MSYTQSILSDIQTGDCEYTGPVRNSACIVPDKKNMSADNRFTVLLVDYTPGKGLRVKNRRINEGNDDQDANQFNREHTTKYENHLSE
jgi:hypothetical protein